MAKFPPALEQGKLYAISSQRAEAFLNTAFANAPVEDKRWFREQVAQMLPALQGDIRACHHVAYLFSDKAYPELADPYLAYQWNMLGFANTDDDNWVAFRAMPGGDAEGTLRMFTFFAASQLAVFGSPEEQQLARDHMIQYVDMYRNGRLISGMIKYLVYTLCGIPAYEAFRTGKYDMSCLVDKELAIRYYKQIIDTELADGYPDAAEAYAKEFEGILGITYYQRPTSKGAGSTGNPSAAPESKGGCYVATCVYGSYDCPQVWTLRRFRDQFLAESVLGRGFIRTYYAVSPRFVRWFGKCKPVCALWKKMLDSMVNRLKAQGYSDAPYKD